MHRPMPLSFFNMDSGGRDTAEEKRQSRLDDEEKHRELIDREKAEENDCRRLSTSRRKDSFHQKQTQLKPESTYTCTVDFSCISTKRSDAVR